MCNPELPPSGDHDIADLLLTAASLQEEISRCGYTIDSLSELLDAGRINEQEYSRLIEALTNEVAHDASRFNDTVEKINNGGKPVSRSRKIARWLFG